MPKKALMPAARGPFYVWTHMKGAAALQQIVAADANPSWHPAGPAGIKEKSTRVNRTWPDFGLEAYTRWPCWQPCRHSCSTATAAMISSNATHATHEQLERIFITIDTMHGQLTCLPVTTHKHMACNSASPLI